MKDLGYKRVPTPAAFRVQMPDSSYWRVPVQCIVDSRDEHYKEDQEDTVKSIRDGSLSDYEIYDWAGNNMNWSDVADYAEKVDAPVKKIDWEEGWSNGDKEIVGKV